jgi:hypothetical protein
VTEWERERKRPENWSSWKLFSDAIANDWSSSSSTTTSRFFYSWKLSIENERKRNKTKQKNVLVEREILNF